MSVPALRPCARVEPLSVRIGPGHLQTVVARQFVERAAGGDLPNAPDHFAPILVFVAGAEVGEPSEDDLGGSKRGGVPEVALVKFPVEAVPSPRSNANTH